MATVAEQQLASVQAAIAAIEGGAQSYSILGRNMTRADLKTLYDREARLEAKIARANRGGMRVTYGVVR